MDLKAALTEVQLTATAYNELRDTLYDVQTLAAKLAECTQPEEVVRLLHVALLDGSRPYFIPRIYGRYRKLVQPHDYEVMHQWAQDVRARR